MRILDGLPLALELAAARIPVLSPAQILGRYRAGLSLEDREGAHPERHRSIRDAVDVSVRLLGPAGLGSSMS
ncbi:MAG: hypothetical protein R3E97_21555 [Candidatus Eisenbacteria bacterium]